MNPEQLTNEDIKVIYSTIELILNRYESTKTWYQKWFSQNKVERTYVGSIRKGITHSQRKAFAAANKKPVYGSLLLQFDEARYITATHFLNEALHEAIQDVMIFLFFYQEKRRQQFQKYMEISSDTTAYLNLLKEPQAYKQYFEHLKKQLSIYGRKKENLSNSEVMLAAREGVIHGKWVEYFGISKSIEHGLKYIKKELQGMLQKKIFSGYLTENSIKDYLQKTISIHEQTHADQMAYVQYARYLIEAILNAAGTVEGHAHHKDHSSLVLSCYWVDEMFLAAKSLFDVPP